MASINFFLGRKPLLIRRSGLLMLMAWFTVVTTYIAALAALAGDNTIMSIASVFNFDTLRPWFFYMGMFSDAQWSVANWRLGNSTFALDLVMSWILFALGTLAGPMSRAQLIFGMYAMPLVWTLVSALGWVKVCRQVWGRDQGRELAVILAHALPFAFFTAGQEYPFIMWFYRTHHVSTWALLPWLWWLWLLALTVRKNKKFKVVVSATLALSLVTFSDMTIAAWFTAPAIVALPLTLVLNGRRSKGMRILARRFLTGLGLYGLPMVFATLLGKLSSDIILYQTSKIDVGFATIARSLSFMSGYMEYALKNTVLMLVCWFAFVIIAVACPAGALRRWWHGKRFIPHLSSNRRKGRTAIALLLPASIIVPIVASAVTGLSEHRYVIGKLTIEFRHLLPTLWLPLFVGWAMLPRIATSLKKMSGWGASLLLAASLGYISFTNPNWQNLNPFATPFHKCFEQYSLKYDWVGGVGSWEYIYFMADPESTLERYLSMHPQGPTSAIYSPYNLNSDWFQGQVNFVVVNDHPQGNRHVPPMDYQAGICHARQRKCPPGHHVINEKISFQQGGENPEFVECQGVRFAILAKPRDFNIKFQN